MPRNNPRNDRYSSPSHPYLYRKVVPLPVGQPSILIFYPLIPVKLIPFTICFSKIKKAIMTGIDAIALAVIGNTYACEYVALNTGIPTGSVYKSSDKIDKYGHRKLFHEPINVKIPIAATAGFASGNTIL